LLTRLRTHAVLSALAGRARWAFAVVPAVGLLELAAHVVQVHSVVPDVDWETARAYVKEKAAPEDLVAFAPPWADPLGREHFGALATLEREARPDPSGFPRALEVSLRGEHLAELDGWSASERRQFGGVTVTTLENPRPVHVLEDLVSMVDPSRMRVWRVDGPRETECAFGHGPVQAGALGFGPAVPGDRFSCPGSFVGVSIAADLEYRPRRCIYAPPPGGAGFVRIRFLGVPMGSTLYGHHALYVEAERDRKGAPVTIRWTVPALAGQAGSVLGSVVHRDGDGWKAFEFDTSELAGRTADVDAEISSPSSDRRMYCFQADTR
jgi:hypothetical protein